MKLSRTSPYLAGSLAATVQGAAYLLAALVYGLWSFGAIGPAEPTYLPSDTDAANWQKYFAYLRADAPYDYAQAILACVGFVMLVPIGAYLRRRLAASVLDALIASALIGAGVLLVAGELMYIGARAAVVDISDGLEVDQGALNIAFNFSTEVSAWVMTGGWLAAGLGLLVLSRVGSAVALPSLVRTLSIAGGIAYCLIGLTEALDLTDVYDVVTVAGGAIIGPLWALEVARWFSSEDGSDAGGGRPAQAYGASG